MKQKMYSALVTILLLSPHTIFAADSTNILGLPDDKLRNGDINITDIPVIIINAINFLMSFAGGIAVIMIIVGAYQMQFGALSSDKSKGKRTIFLALGGFALAALSRIIVKFVIDNFA